MKLPLVMGRESVGMAVDAGSDAGDLDKSKNYIVYPWQVCGDYHQCKDGRENYCSEPRYV